MKFENYFLPTFNKCFIPLTGGNLKVHNTAVGAKLNLGQNL